MTLPGKVVAEFEDNEFLQLRGNNFTYLFNKIYGAFDVLSVGGADILADRTKFSVNAAEMDNFRPMWNKWYLGQSKHSVFRYNTAHNFETEWKEGVQLHALKEEKTAMVHDGVAVFSKSFLWLLS